MRLPTLTLVLGLVTCTACTGGTDSEVLGETYRLAGRGIGKTQGFELDTRQVLEFDDYIDEFCTECEDARVDFAISSHGPVVMDLKSSPFCLKGEDFDSVEDIPSDISNCNWGSAYLASTSQQHGTPLKLGYIVRDRSQSRYWRLRVFRVNFSDASPYFDAVFELAEFED